MSRISFLQDMLAAMFARGEGATAANAPAGADASLPDLCEALLSGRGEVSGARLARTVLARFETSDEAGRLTFFTLLAERFDVDAEHAARAAARYAEEASAANLAILADSVEPRRQELLRRLHELPGATVRLVRMRERLLELVPDHPALARIDIDFRHLFRSWFNRGFLVLREIDWHTPANILEKIIRYEAVHAIGSWAALRARLEPPDRRCFAFFHPAMPDEPLIFVEVALTRQSPSTVREVLWPDRPILDPSEVDTAVFYSISNCQRGLAGISFGNFLIKQVASELSHELPALATFRTLSPVPGLMRWVRSLEQEGAPVDAAPDASAEGTIDEAADGGASAVARVAARLTETAAAAARAAGAVRPAAQGAVDAEGADGARAGDATAAATPDEGLLAALDLARALAAGAARVLEGEERALLERLVAHYLVRVRRDDGQPDDPVARFHLGNGASLDAVLPGADTFRKGRAQSAGVMVSYLYDLERVEANHEAYAAERRVVTSEAVAALLEPRSAQARRAG